MFLPHLAFEYPQDQSNKSPTSTGLVHLLTNIEKIGVVTTYGASLPIIRFVGDPGRRLVARGMRPLMHPECTVLFMCMYRTVDVSNEDRKQFLKRVEEAYEEF